MLRKTVSAGLIAAAAVVVPVAPASAAGTSTTTHERGYAMTCTGERAGTSAFVELYTNNTVTVPAVIVLEGPNGTVVSTDDTAPARITKGKVRADADLMDLETKAPAGEARVKGTYRATGEPTAVHDVFDDAGELIEVTGTNQALSTKLKLKVGRTTYPLTCDPAFRFDLTVTKTPIV